MAGYFTGKLNLWAAVLDVVKTKLVFCARLVFPISKVPTSQVQADTAATEYLAVMSHELRTPLHAIIGFSEMLAHEKDEELPRKTRIEYAQTIVDNSRHLRDLVDDILDSSRMEKGVLQLAEQDVEAGELIEVAIKLCRELAEKANVSIVCRLTDGVSLHGDAKRLQQVIVKLLANAIKFSPPHGIINIDMLKGREGQFVLDIKDAGIGISIGDLERVFEPFVQTDAGLARRFGGVGLGLSISRRIARLHGGDVTLQSVLGAGTTARLTLPASRIQWTAPQSEIDCDVA